MVPYTTLKNLQEANACANRYDYLVSQLGENYGDDTKISLATICEKNGVDDVLWIPGRIIYGDDIETRYRLFAVACCQDILHLMEDQRLRDAVKISHLFAHSEATQGDLKSARDMAGVGAIGAARADARGAAWAAESAAAWAAAWADAMAAASADAWGAARQKQAAHFIRIFSERF